MLYDLTLEISHHVLAGLAGCGFCVSWCNRCSRFCYHDYRIVYFHIRIRCMHHRFRTRIWMSNYVDTRGVAHTQAGHAVDNMQDLILASQPSRVAM